MLAQKLLSGGAETLYVDDVFQSVVRTGTGASATITTGFQPDLIWVKSRSNAYNNYLADSARGITHYLSSNTTGAEDFAAVVTDMVASVNATGYTMGSGATLNGTNNSSQTHVDWVFKKKAKFFDVVTYTGNGAASRAINHSLGGEVGSIIIKDYGASGAGTDWSVWHRSLAAGKRLLLNSTAAQANQTYAFPSAPTDTTFTVGYNAGEGNATNENGHTFVAYLFAHDTSTDGIIQCGSFTTDGSGNATVNLGWEPQYVLRKKTTATDNWEIIDSMRGMPVGGDEQQLQANLSNAETASGNRVTPNATGFKAALSTSSTYIYLAIRRPNKPPTLGTQVYNAIARTGTGAAATVTGVGFAPDLVYANHRNHVGNHPSILDRLRGVGTTTSLLVTDQTGAEQVGTQVVTSLSMDGCSVGTDSNINSSGYNYINHFFRRAVGVHDQVCYTGTGVAKTEAHNLGVVPELMIVKNRGDGAANWTVYVASQGAGNYLYLSSTAAVAGSGSDTARWNGTTPTASVFSVGSADATNRSTYGLVAYLFATKAGISKVGSYTGNGSSQTIDCGFSTGARFILIKRTDSTGDWYVWDTVRGIIAGDDPHLSLNTTAAEVTTDDSIDPDTSGFIVNQLAATNINVTSASYIYLSFA